MRNSKRSPFARFVVLLLVTFIILKLIKVVDWSWVYVLSPLWVYVLVGLIFGFWEDIKDYWEGKNDRFVK